jgi:hypothetical protein
MIRGYSTAGAGHEANDDGWITRNVFLQNRDQRLGPQLPYSARCTVLNQSDEFTAIKI